MTPTIKWDHSNFCSNLTVFLLVFHVTSEWAVINTIARFSFSSNYHDRHWSVSQANCLQCLTSMLNNAVKVIIKQLWGNINCLVQGCSKSFADTLELLQSYTKPSTSRYMLPCYNKTQMYHVILDTNLFQRVTVNISMTISGWHHYLGSTSGNQLTHLKT